jgi:hypothetical protein
MITRRCFHALAAVSALAFKRSHAPHWYGVERPNVRIQFGARHVAARYWRC